MGYETPFIGLLLALLCVWVTGIYPGGIIVPSYLVLFLSEPERIVGTLIAALLTFLVYRLASGHLILFGKRRFVLLILIGGVWAILWRTVIPGIFPLTMEYQVIGWVIPGLIANHFERQGVMVTTAALATVTVLLFFIGRALALL
ncbi:poly-gamma-glutamate biosynthesis protein PgsC [Gemmatimonadota bacterium]